MIEILNNIIEYYQRKDYSFQEIIIGEQLYSDLENELRYIATNIEIKPSTSITFGDTTILRGEGLYEIEVIT